MAFFHFFDGGFAQIFSQIASITVKKLRNTNFISSRHVKRENTSLPVDVRGSETSLLKLPIIFFTTSSRSTSFLHLPSSSVFSLFSGEIEVFWGNCSPTPPLSQH